MTLARLAADACALFVLSPRGRILRENDPDGTEGPRLAVLGCREGNLGFIRHDVADPQPLEAIIAAAPPWFEADIAPPWAKELAAALAPAPEPSVSLVFALPHRLAAAGPHIVSSDDALGRRLLANLERDGVPSHLAEAGFASIGDFWAPWCAVMDQGQIAALAFAARLGSDAAEVGVYTFPRWRRRGFAAQAVAAWTSLAELSAKSLFYSTLASNAPSRGVAGRLRLEQIGAGLRIA